MEVTAVITDKRGQPVTGLTKDDFELRENGKPQSISFFSAGGIGTGEDGGKPSSPGKPKEISEPTRAAPLRSVVIFVDSLNMSAGGLLRAKPALHRLVDEKLTDSDMAALSPRQRTLEY